MPKVTKPAAKATVGDRLKALGAKPERKAPAEPLWKGPESDHEDGGVTFSMLSAFLSCRERFRVKYVVGLRPNEGFSHRLEYGQFWHTCEEAFAAGKDWNEPLMSYAIGVRRKFPLAQEQIEHWYQVCKVQFPIYVEHWEKHPDVTARTPVLQEQVFDVPYKLPSGRTVRLRGKWDGVDLLGAGKAAGIYLVEHKTKGDVDVTAIQRQLTFDLQTMLYLVTLDESCGIYYPSGLPIGDATPIRGVRYNVVRRPLSGGKGSIVQRKGSKNVPPESSDEYYARLGSIIREAPEDFFWRWKVEVTPADVARFRRECLDPILEQLCLWYEAVTTGAVGNVRADCLNYRHPFGAGGAVDEYGWQDIDDHLATGSTVGLTRNELFRELK